MTHMSQHEVDLANLVVQTFLFSFWVGTIILFYLIGDRLQRIADRYRLKYGFDKDIEAKEISKEDTDLKLEKRERSFKRRTFKD